MNRVESTDCESQFHRPRTALLVCGLICCLASLNAITWQLRAADQNAATTKVQTSEPSDDAPLPPEEAASTMIVPEGFHVTLFAGEPDVKQPIGYCIDDRGRLWVAEAYSYPHHATEGHDQIVILEDSDGDGHADKRTVFYDQLNYVTGIEVGFGGAWVMSPPYFYFIPDRDSDDRPDGPPEVVLDGFGTHANSHNLANGFSWGPDGWLYGTHGRTNWSTVGKPGTPDNERIHFDGGVYRFHPTRRVWEPFCDGTTNPWGIDWNDRGDAFICNCVNPHLFQVIYGAHYEPWRNRESSQYAYQRIPTIADHLHFVGGANTRGGLGTEAEDAAGGGHAHCGTMIYLGDSWPESYRNSLFTNNIHGRRINNDLLKRHGSGYTASHGRDLMRSRDPWYMGVTLRYGPDGGVFASDWSDTVECHSIKNTRRETGRIYKINYRDRRVPAVDLTRLSDRALVDLHSHRNDWFVQHARRLLQERISSEKDLTEAVQQLRKIYSVETDIPRKLRVLWTLQAIGKLDHEFLVSQLDHPHESIRAWAVKFLCEDRNPSAKILDRFAEMAKNDNSQYVRLNLASMLQRLRQEDRWSIAQSLMMHAEDADDENLPLMIWYAIEPLVNENIPRFVALAEKSRLPLVTQFISRRAASFTDPIAGLATIIDALSRTDDVTVAALLTGTREGLAGRRSVPMPVNWPKVFDRLDSHRDESIREQAMQLALVFDDPRAVVAFRKMAADPDVTVAIRNRAIDALVARHVDDMPSLLFKLVSEPGTRRSSIRGLAEYNDPDTASNLLAHYATFDAPARQDVVQTLASRVSWAMQLMAAVESQQVPRADVTAYTARQMQSLKNPELNSQIKTIWGELRTTPAEKELLIAKLKKQLAPSAIQQANRSTGRAIFQKTCANCHRFFDAGGSIGPNITGSQRTNLDYLLQTLVDPSAAVAKEFQLQLIETTGGRVISGIVVAESPTAITMQTVNEKVVIPVAEIETRQVSPLSIMPEGMLQSLTVPELRGLFAYLMGPNQVPIPGNDPPAKN